MARIWQALVKWLRGQIPLADKKRELLARGCIWFNAIWFLLLICLVLDIGGAFIVSRYISVLGLSVDSVESVTFYMRILIYWVASICAIVLCPFLAHKFLVFLELQTEWLLGSETRYCNRPAPRVTTAKVMLMVFLTGLFCLMVNLRQVYYVRYEFHIGMAQRHALNGTSPSLNWARESDLHAYHMRLATKYKDAAYSPWLIQEPDPLPPQSALDANSGAQKPVMKLRHHADDRQ